VLDEQIARFRVSLLVDQEGAYHHRRVDIEHRSGSARVESRKDRPSAIPPTDELGEGASRGLELLDGWTRRRRCCSKDTGGGSTFHEVPRRAVHPLGADWDVEAMRSHDTIVSAARRASARRRRHVRAAPFPGTIR